MKMVAMGNKKKVFKSIKLMAEANGKDYMVVYMRIRMGMSPSKAVSLPVRKYTKA